MWAAKLPGEGAALYDACTAMCEVMSKLSIAVDGGKDSLSMAARVDGDIVKAPGMYILQANRTLGRICSCVTIQEAFYPAAILWLQEIKLTTCDRIPLDKLLVAHLVKILHTFYGTTGFISMIT
jgi:hypothetical protein